MASQQSDCLVVYNCWQCSKCKFFTPLLKNKCNSCGKDCHFDINEKLEKLDDGTENTNKIIKNEWKCTWCSIDNDTNNNNCQLCGQARHVDFVKTEIQEDKERKEPNILDSSNYSYPSNLVHLLNGKNNVPYGQSNHVVEQESPEILDKESPNADNSEEYYNKILYHKNDTINLTNLKHMPYEQFNNIVDSKNRQLIDKNPKQETCQNSFNSYPTTNLVDSTTFMQHFNSIVETERQPTISQQLINNNQTEPTNSAEYNRKLARGPILDNCTCCGHLHNVEPVSRSTVIRQLIDKEAIISDDYFTNSLPYPQHILDKLSTTDSAVRKLYDNKQLIIPTISEKSSSNAPSYPEKFIDKAELKTKVTTTQHIVDSEKQAVIEDYSKNNGAKPRDIVDGPQISNNSVRLPQEIFSEAYSITPRNHLISKNSNNSTEQSQEIVSQNKARKSETYSVTPRNNLISKNSNNSIEQSQKIVSQNEEIKPETYSETPRNHIISNNSNEQSQEIVSQNKTIQPETYSVTPENIVDKSQTLNNSINFKWINDIIVSESQLPNDVQINKEEEKQPSITTIVQQFFKKEAEKSSSSYQENQQPIDKGSAVPIIVANNSSSNSLQNVCVQLPDNTESENHPINEQSTVTESALSQETKDTWQCQVCTLINPLTAKHCKACDTSIPGNITEPEETNNKLSRTEVLDKANKNGWQCPACSVINPLMTTACKTCNQIYTKVVVQNKQDDNWICSQCTLANPSSLDNCELCAHLRPTHLKKKIKRGRKKPKKKKMAHQHLLQNIPENTWVCPTCTFENQTNLKTCKICEQKRPTDLKNTTQEDEMHEESETEQLYNSDQNIQVSPNNTLENPANLNICQNCQNKTAEINETTVEKTTIQRITDFVKLFLPSIPENAWKCSNCALENPLSLNKCAVCEHNQTIDKTTLIVENPISPVNKLLQFTPENIWKCPNCTLENPSNINKCRACDHNQTIDLNEITFTVGNTSSVNKPLQFTSENIWKCSNCTLENPPSINKCQACDHNQAIDTVGNTSTSVNNLLQFTPESIWKCSNCTLENPTNINKCQACDHNKTIDLNETVFTVGNTSSVNKSLQFTPEIIWKCSNCTLENPLDINKCQACDHNRPLQALQDSSAPQEVPRDMWKCPACTFLNTDNLKDCQACGQYRNFQIVDVKKLRREAAKRNESYRKYVDLNMEGLVVNPRHFDCLICLTDCPKGKGVILRECLHEFCRECLVNTVTLSEDTEIKCPFIDNNYACDRPLQEREIRALVSEQVHERRLARAARQAETCMQDAFHCKTNDCIGWCTFEGDVNDFWCPICLRDNCINCQAIHEDENCKEYQERIETEARTNEEAKKTLEGLQDMLQRREAMHCPKCQIIIMKKSGCDSLQCPICKVDICWVTRGPRWGPAGRGDISGGCRCRINGPCHPDCGNCH